MTATKAQNEMESGFLLNIVITEGTAIFQLLAGEDQALLIRWDTFLVLDLGLDILNGISRFDIESDGLAGKGFDENLE